MAAGREWIVASLVAIVAAVLLLVPYALGYALSSPPRQFTGVIMNPEDSQSYFAKMLEGYDGHWLYTIPFTTEGHAPAFVGGFYLALGHLARAVGVSLPMMWHVARFIANLILFLTTFGFIATFLYDHRARWTAYLLALFGSGLGWVLFLLDQPYWLGAFPVDFKMPEAHLFFTALTFPHVQIGTALILASVWCINELGLSRDRIRWRYVIGAGIANLALAIVYPFLIYLVVLISGLYLAWLTWRARQILWRKMVSFTIAFLIPAPLVLYYAVTLGINPVFRAWDAQSITLSPPLPHYLLAFGLMLLLALSTLLRKQSEHSILWLWILAAALLAYAPLNSQRRFVQGVHVPLAMLASVGLVRFVLPHLNQTHWFQSIARRPRYSIAGLERLLIVAFVAFMSLSNLYVFASVSLTAAVEQPYPLFRLRDEIAAVDWLRANTQRTEVVLSAYETGNWIASRAGNRVVLGHWAETLDFERKYDEVERFYTSSIDDVARARFLHDHRVVYVFWGPRERIAGNFDPERVKYLERVFANDRVRIYRVRNP